MLIQYFDGNGMLSTMALVKLADMIELDKGGYTFFSGDAHLRYYMDTVQQHREAWLDREDAPETGKAP